MGNSYQANVIKLEEGVESRRRAMADNEVFIGSLDQGTTSTRFIIYDESAHVVGSHQIEFTQYYPEAG